MNYNKLENLRKLKKISQDVLAKEIGLTKNGYQLAIKNDTLKVKDLESIVSILGVSISYFFTDSQISDTSVTTCKNCEQIQKLVDSQNRHIERLETELEGCRKQEKRKAS